LSSTALPPPGWRTWRLAGVSKGTLFVYFATKEELFRAVAQHLLAMNLASMQQIAQAPDLPLRDIVPRLLAQSVAATWDACRQWCA
jgi:AcrR family transcriptional regulator